LLAIKRFSLKEGWTSVRPPRNLKKVKRDLSVNIAAVYASCDEAVEAAKTGKRLKAYHRLLAANEAANELVKQANLQGRYADYSGAHEAIAEAAQLCRIYSETVLSLEEHVSNDRDPTECRDNVKLLRARDTLWRTWTNTDREATLLPRVKPNT
jgi:hypothetical protein